MIAVASLQLGAGKSLARKRAGECAAGLLCSCAKWRHRCQQKYGDELVHAPLLKQSRRVVQSLSKLSNQNRSATAKKLLKQLSSLNVP
jgi:hypothetical protein